jgi:hypothetical protein
MDKKTKIILVAASIFIILVVSGVLIYIYVIKKPTCKSNSDCSNNGECDSSGKCKCRPDFKGDDCKQRSTSGCPTGCLSPNGKCDPSGKCNCETGFTGDDCKIIECPGDCSPNGTCDSSTGICLCAQGYGPGDCNLKKCPGVGDCSYPNGTCNSSTGECKCNGGFTGPFCSAKECLSACNPLNSACNTSGKCECKDGFTGENCEIVRCPGVGDCLPNGECNSSTGECKCNDGFTGLLCDVDIRLRFNTAYYIKSNYDDAYVTICGKYNPDNLPTPPGPFNVTIGDKPLDTFMLINEADETSTYVVKTGDRFYIKAVRYGTGGNYIGAMGEAPCSGTTAVITSLINFPGLEFPGGGYLLPPGSFSTFNLESIANSSTKEVGKINKEYIIRISDYITNYMGTCGTNKKNDSYCDVSIVGFYSDVSYQYKNWKFVLP